MRTLTLTAEVPDTDEEEGALTYRAEGLDPRQIIGVLLQAAEGMAAAMFRDSFTEEDPLLSEEMAKVAAALNARAYIHHRVANSPAVEGNGLMTSFPG